MADPFNFTSLRKETPTYLGLSSLKEALPSAEKDDQDQFPSVIDVSMEDQVISDDEEPESSYAREDKMEDEVGSLETHRDSTIHTSKSGSSQEPSEHAPGPTTEESSDTNSPGSVYKVLSPTQFGAHWALDSPANTPSNNNSYGYEVRMPIPVPWHENLPYTLSTYLQLLFNFGVGLVGVYLVLVAKRDVSAIIRERSDEIALKASWCHQQYVVNRCSPDRMVPHLAETCLDLERCMDRDPANLRWLSVHASLLSEVLNALIEPLTVRTMISLGLLAFAIGLVVFMINYLFGFLRARTYFPEKSDVNQRQMHISALPHRAYDEGSDK